MVSVQARREGGLEGGEGREEGWRCEELGGGGAVVIEDIEEGGLPWLDEELVDAEE